MGFLRICRVVLKQSGAPIQRYAKEAAKLYFYIEKWLYQNPQCDDREITENMVVKGVTNTETVRNIEIK